MFVLLFLTGISAGFINVMAGGGSTLTLPVLIFLGLDGALANGTNRLAILIQNMVAVYGFRKSKLSAFKTSSLYALITLPGAVLGAFAAIQLDDFWFKKILGVVIVFVIATLAVPKPKEKNESRDISSRNKIFLFFSLFGAGFYGGFIQAGVGFILMAILFYFAGLNLLKVNMHKVFIVFVYTVPAFLIFAFSGNVDWLLGLVLASGNGIGGWIAARLSVKKGEKIIRAVLIIVLIGMAVKLVLF